MFKANRALILFLIYVGLAFLSYHLFKPMAFLLASGIVLSILYFIQASALVQPGSIMGKKQQSALTLSSLVILTLLFVLSVFVLRDYQRPSGDEPYFVNADHHAVQNTGVAFDGNLFLYAPENNGEGLWTSEGGTLQLETTESAVQLKANGFYTPVFSLVDDSVELLNPVWSQPLVAGYSITDGKTRLSWLSMESEGDHTYRMEVVFQTQDPLLLGNKLREIGFSDTFRLEARIRKGLSLMDLLQGLEKKAANEDRSSLESSPALLVDGLVYQWLSQIGRLEIIAARKSDENGVLFLQPSEQMISDGYRCSVNGRPVSHLTSYTLPLQLDQLFFIGLGRDRYPLKVLPSNRILESVASTKSSVLLFEDHQLWPFYSVPGNGLKPGETVLRFLKNNYDLDTLSDIREGFMFQRNMKVNRETSVDGLLEFEADKTGVPLKWRTSFGKFNEGEGNFILTASSGKTEWLYAIRDLSDNWFGYSIVKYYLFFIVLTMMILIVFFPSPATILIETPLLVMVYCLLVFRYLLLWRIATFPPLENIKKFELQQTIRQFDNWPVKDAPSSFTFLVVMSTLIFLMVFRYHKGKDTWLTRLISKTGTKFSGLMAPVHTRFPSYKWTVQFFVFLVFCSVLTQIPGILERLSRIAFPLFGYLFFSYRALSSGQKISFLPARYRHWTSRVVPFFSAAAETEQVLIGLLPLAYFAIFDTGFAIIFLMFLLIRFALFTLLRYRSNLRLPGSSMNPRLIPLMAVVVLLGFLLLWKGSIHFLLKNSIPVLVIGMIFLMLLVYVLNIVSWAKKFLLSLFVVLIVLSVIPFTGREIQGLIDQKIRLVKYRAELIYKPMEAVLLENRFQSNQEAKILETAQNQWFIHSYLKEATFLDPLKKDGLIDFRPHFRTGVDYSTQTRDVVLPRYVIGEFGGFTMLLLLCFCTLPMVLYLIGYRITNPQKTSFLPDGSVGLMALVFLFTTALMLWLTSTNRFVFFGQDFPFLSITSRISAFVPMGLVVAVLVTNPVRLARHEISTGRNWGLIVSFILFVVLAGFLSGKSSQITDSYFRVDYSEVEGRVNNKINEWMADVQRNMKLDLLKNEELRPEEWTPDIRKVVDSLVKHETFLQWYKDSFTVYERGIWDRLKSDVTMGVRLNSPVHFKVDHGMLQCVFNPYWSMELPPYDERKVWKGEVEQQPGLQVRSSELMLINTQGVRLMRIPHEYLRTPEDLAILDITNNAGDAFVYNAKSRQISQAGAASYARLIDKSDLVIRPKGGSMDAFTVFGREKRYFARNVLLNGRQQMMYPLGSHLFWARHWAAAVKERMEDAGEAALEESVDITLDYQLTREVGTYLEKEMPGLLKQNIPEMKDPAFSVIAADGDGRIRLMNDYALQRRIIDPNNEPEVLEEQKRSYFYIDAAKERIQWGNLNLLHMNQGPGSSFKPLLAASVISQANAGWERLELLPKNGPLFDFGKGISYYANESLRGDWKGLSNDNSATDFSQYLIRSNNLYHSLLVFLGSYTKQSLLDAGGSVTGLLRPYQAASAAQDTAFPIMRHSGSAWQFQRKGKWPQSADGASQFGHPESMLSMGLKQCMGLDTDTDNGRNIRNRKYVFSRLNDSSTWGTPEYSYMLLSNRTASNDPKGNFNMAIRQTSLGGGGVFDVTPLAMTEMFGRLATMNAGYKLTIDAPRSTSNTWYPAQEWKGGYSSFHYNTLMDALRKVVTMGTAQSLQLYVKTPYYIYAKTGTIGAESGRNSKKNSKRLALIISKEPLTSPESVGKFFVVFFRFDNARMDDTKEGWIYQIYGNVLNRLLNSASFKKYMEEGK